jgi:phospholipid/cholesterol/gamma-HCH transport system substrate-binding protein
MRESVRNFSIGVVSIVGLGGLATLLLLFGEFSSLVQRRYPVDVALNAAGGLRQGSLVTLHGVPVGLVDRVGIASDDALRPVRVRLVIDNDVRIPDPPKPSVEASLLGSGARLELVTNGFVATGRSFEPGAVPLLVGEFQPIDQKLLAALDERFQGVQRSLASFEEFATTYTKLGQELSSLVAPLGPDASDADREASLRTTVERMNRALADATDAIDLARTWLGDEAMRADVRTAITNASELFARATDTVNVIGGLAANLDADRARLVAELLPVFDETTGALGDVRRLLATAERGQGTVGRLLNDPALYNDLADSAKRLSAALASIQALVEKLRAEGIVIEF